MADARVGLARTSPHSRLRWPRIPGALKRHPQGAGAGCRRARWPLRPLTAKDGLPAISGASEKQTRFMLRSEGARELAHCARDRQRGHVRRLKLEHLARDGQKHRWVHENLRSAKR